MSIAARNLLVIAAAVPTLASLSAASAAAAPTIDNPNRYAVSGVESARRFWALAASRRVDIAIVGDSNTRTNASGHEDGMARAFAARFGMYGSAVDPCVSLGWWGATVGGATPSLGQPFFPSVAPAGVNAITFDPLGNFPASSASLAAGVQTLPSYNFGLTLSGDHPMDITGPLRYHMTHWLFGPGSGGYLNFSFREAWPGDARQVYSVSTTVDTAGQGPGLQDVAVDVPAGPRVDSGVVACPSNAVTGAVSRGPACLVWQRFENTSKGRGIAYSPLWGAGGLGAYHACIALKDARAAAPLQEWFRQATMLQSGPPVLLVQVLFGGNDINHAQFPSQGPVAGWPSSTPQGQEDNTRGIINALRRAWVGSGRDPANLYFLLGPYHPFAYPNAVELQPQYEEGWRTIASDDPQVFTVAGTMLSTPEELLAKGMLSQGTDPAHLNPDGYRRWGRAALSALNRALCPGDFGEDGRASVGDVFTFLDAWFRRQLRADFNNNGSVDVADILSFLNAWFTGCR